jgi:type I restriction enzyme M protein
MPSLYVTGFTAAGTKAPMPFTPDMRRKVDQIRDYLYGGGYPDPLSNAEQLSFLFFFYMIEGIDSANLRQVKATGRDYTSLFAGDWTLRNPLNAPTKGVETVPRERMRWSIWANAMSGEQLVTFVRDEVFPFFATIERCVSLAIRQKRSGRPLTGVGRVGRVFQLEER